MVCSSVTLLLNGVPVAKTTPFPPVFSSRYLHFIKRSRAFWEAEVEMPEILFSLVGVKRFLNSWASSTNSLSTPSCSKVMVSSWFFCSLSRFFSSDFFVLSMALIWNLLPSLRFSSSIPDTISSICDWIIFSCRSFEIGIMPSWEWPIITASKFPVAILANNCWRFSFWKSFLVATRILADG